MLPQDDGRDRRYSPGRRGEGVREEVREEGRRDGEEAKGTPVEGRKVRKRGNERRRGKRRGRMTEGKACGMTGKCFLRMTAEGEEADSARRRHHSERPVRNEPRQARCLSMSF